MILGSIFAFALNGAENFTPEEEKAAQSLAWDMKIDPYQQGKNTPSEFITNRFYMMRYERWTVRTKERHGYNYPEAVKRLAEFAQNWEKGKKWQVKVVPQVIPYFKNSPKIDGNLSVNEWDNALKFQGEYKVGSPELYPGKENTLFFIAYHNESFYIAAKFTDENVYSYSDRGFANAPKPLYAGDALEFFIRPDTTLPYYCEVQVNPDSLVWAIYNKSSPFGGWDMLESCTENHGITAKSSVTDNCVVIEMQVPFKFISKYADMKNFSFMLVRADRSGSKTHMSATAFPLLYDVHNIFGYLPATLEEKTIKP